ncbi:efflux RND transporter periplasmic adaptor subunit [Paenibacillus sp. OAS669]|uniref:efflux RND transporter periplasmic adaptor subunit n=1 Tax=Paenibacillus sp. OAS669 TaxID=2663821 RepID=UPI00178A0F13|nr:efflux RND transporter periplasmic adaptor subunit [Paenibacillus sp. OAS669]MBE1444990.1 multidrug efflux pump subunit AcrA (membrane-fusion protein) [Paenibacillus sp. OAS669]
MNQRKRKSQYRRLSMTAGSFLLVAALAAGCASPKTTDTVASTQSDTKSVKVAAVTKQSMGDPKEQIADVVAASQVDVSPKVDGQVLQVLKKRGDVVQQGEVIFKLDTKDAILQKQKSEVALKSAEDALQKTSEDLNNSRTELQNSITKAQQQLDNVTKDYNKMHNDYDAGLVTKHQLEQSEMQVNNAQLDLQNLQNKLDAMDKTNGLASAQSQVDSARISIQDIDNTLDNYEVKAPTSGVLTDLSIEVGQTLARGSKVGQVQQIDPIKIKADLSETAAQLARGKQELSFYSADNPGRILKGRVTYLADVMNSQTKSFPLELEVSNTDGYLKPGTRVQVQLTTQEEQQVIAVPSLSIVREGSDAFVFLLKGGQAVKTPVKLGRINETYQEVLEGVKAGDELVVSGQHQLKDGQKVTAVKEQTTDMKKDTANEPAKTTTP